MTREIETSNEDEAWCAERRVQVVAHLKSERVKHAELSDWPAWHVAPIVALWSVGEKSLSVVRARWVICGDVPIDSIAGDAAYSPRAALRAFAARWHSAAAQMAKALPTKKLSAGKTDRAHELAMFLEVRARQLTSWANDDAMWDADDL